MNALLLLSLFGCATELPTWARARVIEDWSDGVGGPKSMAGPGDFVIENDRIKLGVLSGHRSLGPSIHGGTIIDVDLQRYGGEWTNGQGNDRFAEMFPTVSLLVPEADDEAYGEPTVTIVNDGADGGAAVIRVAAPAVGFLELVDTLAGITGVPSFWMITDYILDPGASYLRIRTTAWVDDGSGAPPDGVLQDGGELLAGTYDGLPIITYALETGLAFGDFFLQGGDVDVFAPGIGFDEDGAVYDYSSTGNNTFVEPFQFDFVAGAADGVSYALGALDGDVYVPLFTSSQTALFGAGVEGAPKVTGRFPGGEAFTYERVLSVGYGDVASAVEGLIEARGAPAGAIEGYVIENGTLEGVSHARVLIYEPGAPYPYSAWTTDVDLADHSHDGSFGGALPAGEWELVVHEHGRPPGVRVKVQVADGETLQLTLTADRAGEAHFNVVDERGQWVPSKITIFPADRDGDGLPDPARNADLGDGYLPSGIEAVLFAPYGESEILLPAGDYTAIASRGPEYELGVVDFRVDGSQALEMELQVVRSVDTTGWVSADFHIHSQPSHDSGVSLAERVFTMVSEHVEFMVSTDHDYITDFAPVIEDLQLEPFIASAVGLESTPIEFGHFLGFPLVHDYLEPNGGAFNWEGLLPDEILEEFNALGVPEVDPVRFVAHPRDGILGYFDQYGFSAFGGSPGSPLVETPVISLGSDILEPGNFTLEFEALELLNGKRFDFMRHGTQEEMDDFVAGGPTDGYDFIERTMDEQQALIDAAESGDGTFQLGYGDRGQIDDWFTLLNLGYRFTALGNSDTHGKTSTESGCPRNYVASSTDDPAYLTRADITEAVAAGQVVASYGPFVRFFVADDPDQGIGSEIQASGPVSFYVEVQSPTWFDVSRLEVYENGTLIQEHDIPTPNADVVNFAQEITVEPQQDSWYVVVAMGDDDLSPLFTPVEIPPVQLQDVVLEALVVVPAVASFLSPAIPIPLTYPVYPYALTNPIWVDTDGGGFDPPGVPDWMIEPVEPVEGGDSGLD